MDAWKFEQGKFYKKEGLKDVYIRCNFIQRMSDRCFLLVSWVNETIKERSPFMGVEQIIEIKEQDYNKWHEHGGPYK